MGREGAVECLKGPYRGRGMSPLTDGAKRKAQGRSGQGSEPPERDSLCGTPHIAIASAASPTHGGHGDVNHTNNTNHGCSCRVMVRHPHTPLMSGTSTLRDALSAEECVSAC